ncbi:MAG: NUMOD3 domain-containing DNA-binding protein [Nanoarchaeota archaeon]
MNYKGGKPHCLNCNKILASYYSKRCKSCNGKFKSGKNHPNYGKHHSPEIIEKIKQAIKGKSARYWLGKKRIMVMKKKLCCLCREIYQPRNGASGYCDSCRIIKRKEWNKKYHDSPRAKEKRKYYNRTEKAKQRFKRFRSKPQYRIYARNRYHSQPENKRKAQYYMSNAIRDKRLIKTKSCLLCGGNEVRIEGHHYKGYDPENWLNVIWLDVPCHKKAHEVVMLR